MNVDEALAKWKQLRKHYCMPAFPQTIVDTLAAEVERLRAELAQLRKDWCDDDEAIKQQALRVLPKFEVEGDSVHVPRMGALAEMMAGELVKVRAELAAAKAASVCPVEMQNEQDGEQIAIKGMSHFYGDLWILHDGDEYFWLLDNYNGGDWQPITKQLYDALLDYNKRAKEADKTPPEA